MNKNSQEIGWVAVSLFVMVLVVMIIKPFAEDGTTNIGERFESVTTGGDWKPPTTWEPGK